MSSKNFHILEIPLFRTPAAIMFGLTPEKWQVRIKKEFGDKAAKDYIKTLSSDGPQLPETFDGLTISFLGGSHNVIWFQRPNPDIGLIVHESLHLVNKILEHVGVSDEETAAYLLQEVVTTICNRCRDC